MAQFKRQSIQKLVVEQAGSERLLLNDLIIGREGAEAVAQLIPQYHPNLLHLEIKGNNIDSEGFEALFMALMHCPGLLTIQAEWNNLGSSAAGLAALVYLLRNLRFVELVDLKNNKLTHQHADLLAELLRLNARALKVLDLRWNEIGEVGAQALFPALASNAHLRALPLDDNRVSTHTLHQFADLLRNPARGTQAPLAQPPTVQAPTSTLPEPYFPISEGSFPSMEAQMKTAQLRGKIESEQQEAVLGQEKVQLEIQKAIQKIRVKGSQLHEAQVRYDALQAEATNLLNALREAERMLALEKERFLGVERGLSGEKGAVRTEKYQVGQQAQALMEKTVVRQQKELEDLNAVMAQKHDRLQNYLRDRLADKRATRDKLAEVREDVLRFKLTREAIWDRAALAAASARTHWEEECQAVEEAIGRAEAAVKAERRKGEYLGEELSGLVMKGLRREEKGESEVFEVQGRIKELHKQMTLANVEIEEKQSRLVLREAAAIEKDAAAELHRRYIKYIHSQNAVNLDIERLKHDEDAKATRLAAQTLELRITDLERALRHQHAQNKIIANHYDKILAQLEAASKNIIQAAIFE